ncbi:hypothetical protein P0G10_19395, partial [Eubacteriales bacterium DFI.9.88]|nr:hypothetical protein [Eubacteriales bacterium DFI.9.88]
EWKRIFSYLSENSELPADCNLQLCMPDRVIVEGRPIENIVLAISKEDFACWKGKEAYEVLLQQQIIEGGALDNAE